MSKLKFSIKLPAQTRKMLELATDYEHFQNYMPQQIKSIKIIKKVDHDTITEEVLTFTSILKKEIKQQTKHNIDVNEIHSKIITGPFKNSVIDVLFEKFDDGTQIHVTADLRIPMKYKIASLIIKKSYKIFLTSILYKMNAEALESS